MERKLESTRGLLVAVQGVRPKVANSFGGQRMRHYHLDGWDLAQILAGLVDLRML